MAVNLTEDLIIEILCKLPVKSLVGFKCVSKKWNILISSVCVPRISHVPSPLSGFVFHSGRLRNPEERFIDYVSFSGNNANANASTNGFVESFSSLLPSEYSPYDLLDCCNGLILLISRSVPRYYVCNPATKHSVAIPKAIQHVQVYHAALAFNPSESSCYKVIRFVYALCYSVSNPPAIDIYSSESNQWIRRLVRIEPPVAYGVPWVKYSVYLEGMLYKLSLSKHLLCFDIKSVSVQAVDIPYKDKINTCGFIGVSKGVVNYANQDSSRILIWHFEYHNKARCYWILKHSIRIDDLRAKHPACLNPYLNRNSPTFMPYAVHPDSDIVFLGVPNMIFSYHLKTHNFELLFTRSAEKELVWGHFCFYPYSPCFIMLNDVKKRCCNAHSCSKCLFFLSEL